MKIFIFPLIILLLVVSGYGMTKKECCDECEKAYRKCVDEASHFRGWNTYADCRAQYLECKMVDCGGGCSVDK